MSRVFYVVLLCFVLLPATIVAQQNSTRHQEGLAENTPSSYVLKGADVVVKPGTVVKDASLVIRDGRIVSVRGSNDWPADHQVIDMKGKMIYAGFIDAYNEQTIVISETPEHAVYWNANIRPSRDVTRSFEWEASATDSMKENGITAALVSPGAGIFKGQSALILTDEVNLESSVLVPQFAQSAELTVQRRFGGPRIYPSSPMGAVALARQALLDAQWYEQAWQIANEQADVERPEINASLAALGKVLAKEQPLMVDSSNELMSLRAHRFAEEFDLDLIIVGSGNEYRRLDEIKQLDRPMILPVSFPAPPAVATPEDALNVTLESLMHWDLAPENPAKLAEAGVSFAFTTKGLESTGDYLKRIRQAVQRGLDAEDALAAMTTVPAKMFGAEKQVGTVETGKLANLVIVDGDLFEEKTKIVETWVAGRRYQHQTDPSRQVGGTWKVTVDGQELDMKVTQGGSSISGEFHLPADGDEPSDDEEDDENDAATKTEKMKSMVLVGARLSGSFNAKEFDQKGTAQFSLIISADSEAAEGYIIWPDGSRQPMTAELTERASETKDAADEGAGNQQPRRRRGGRGAGRRGGGGGGAPGGAAGGRRRGGGGGGGGASGSNAANYSKEPATFATNYPLGAFGVDEVSEVETVLFDNMTVWTCGEQGILENAAVLIKDGKIAGVYDSETERPSADRVVDGEGKHLTPGIIDCHSHFASDSGINEGSQAITSEVRIGDFIDCDDITIYRQLAGGVTASNILHGSANPIGGQNQVVKLRWGMNDQQLKMIEAPQGIKFALGENVKRSRNAGNRRPDDPPPRYPTTRMGVEQLMHNTFRSALQYKAKREAWNSDRKGLPPRRDLELDAIVEILEGSRWIHCHSYRQDEILALIRVLDEYDITIGTFQHILEGYKVAEKMAEHGAMASAFSDWWAYKFEVYDAIPYAGKLMHDAGVVVSFNSDDGELATHLNQEAAKAVKYGGVPEAEALKFVTLNPAKQLRIDQYVGSIEKGKHADIAIWNASPLSSFARCEQTWIDGRKFFDVQQDMEMQQQVAEMRQTLIQKILNSGEKMRSDDSRNDDSQNLWPRYDEYCGSHINKNDDSDMLQQLNQAWMEELEEEQE